MKLWRVSRATLKKTYRYCVLAATKEEAIARVRQVADSIDVQYRAYEVTAGVWADDQRTF